MHAQAQVTKSAESLAWSYFLADPQATVDDISHKIKKEATDAIERGRLVSIRRWVKEGRTPTTQNVISAPFNSPRKESSTQERRNWLQDWALEHAGYCTIADARSALEANFGVALGTNYIAEVVKQAKDLTKMDAFHSAPRERAMAREPAPATEKAPEVVSGAKDGIPGLVAALKAAGVVGLEISGETYKVTMAGNI